MPWRGLSARVLFACFSRLPLNGARPAEKSRALGLGFNYQPRGRWHGDSRADGVAAKLDAAYLGLLVAIERASSDDWRSTCTDGQWTKAYAAYHAAASIAGISRMVGTLASGQAPPSTTASSWDEIDAMNASHAKEHADCTPAEAIGLLRRDGTDAVASARGLTDEQLDRSVPPMLPGMPDVTVEQFVEMVLIGHPMGHLRTITGST